MPQILNLSLRAFLAALIFAPINANAAATELDYAASDGSFLMSEGNLRVKNYEFGILCVDLSRGVKYDWAAYTQQWNNDVIANQNPSNDTGGHSTSGLNAGPYYAHVSAFDSPGEVIANFGASSIPTTPGLPTGYSWWGSSTTWNSADKGGGTTLSMSDLMATMSGFSAVRSTNSISGSDKKCYAYHYNPSHSRVMRGFSNSTASISTFAGTDANGASCYNGSGFANWYQNTDTGVRCGPGQSAYKRRILSTNPLASGNRCVEVELTNTAPSSASAAGFGLANTSLPWQGKYVGEDTNSIGVHPTNSQGDILYNNATQLSTGTHADGTTIMLCTNGSKLWVYNAATAQWNGDVIGNQNPVGSVGGVTLPAGTLYWAMNLFDAYGGQTGYNFKWNFGATAFSNSLPTGYVSQDAVTATPRSRAVIIQ